MVQLQLGQSVYSQFTASVTARTSLQQNWCKSCTPQACTFVTPSKHATGPDLHTSSLPAAAVPMQPVTSYHEGGQRQRCTGLHHLATGRRRVAADIKGTTITGSITGA
mmetsp:Transcript_197/g.453  ORF Transcript_197/g.453 Transcript_197/m.453 type:complete len:108 (-) Transcript_197:659-982(-)